MTMENSDAHRGRVVSRTAGRNRGLARIPASPWVQGKSWFRPSHRNTLSVLEGQMHVTVYALCARAKARASERAAFARSVANSSQEEFSGT
jgi:hypothetical protein